MMTSTKYRWAMPTTECIRLLRESADAAEWYAHFSFTYGLDSRVIRDNGRFVLGSIAGSIQPDGNSSIVTARLSPPLWESMILMFGPVVLMIFGPFPTVFAVIWLLLASLILLGQMANISKPFDNLKTILPPERDAGFEVVSRDESEVKLQS